MEQDLSSRFVSLQMRKDGDEDVEISGLTEDAAGASGAGDEAVSRGRLSGEERLCSIATVKGSPTPCNVWAALSALQSSTQLLS